MKRSINRLAFGLVGLLLLAPVSAYATPGGEGNNTGCNGQGNPNSPCEGNGGTPGSGGNGGNGGSGGAGGAGGQGGTGVGVGVGVGVGIGQGGRASATGGQATATGGRATGGRARSEATATGGQGGSATVTNNVSGGGTNGNGGGTYTVRNVPDAYAPPLAGGANPCVVGISLGGSIVGGGAAGGITWNDDDCEARVRAIILHNMAQSMSEPRLSTASIELLCENRATRRAFQRAGMPCSQDRPAPAPTAPAAPTATVVSAASVTPAVRTRPDWCDTMTPGERRQYASACNPQ